MRLALLIVARDKAPFVERAARCALAQACTPIEVLLSDQGSTDGTREILDRVAAEYRGPHQVRRLDCPDTARKGMAGLNAHLEWAMKQTNADIVAGLSADDFALPEHAANLLAAFEAHPSADWVGAATWYAKPDDVEHPHSRTPPRTNGWVSVADIIRHKVGGSTAGAWTRRLWDKAGCSPGITGLDVYLPPIAAALGGFWYLDTPGYVYVQHADPQNMGLGGVLAAMGECERAPVIEQMHFQVGSGWRAALDKLVELGAGTQAEREALAVAAYQRFCRWADVRGAMTFKGIAPKAFPI